MSRRVASTFLATFAVAVFVFVPASSAFAQAERPRTVLAVYWGSPDSPANAAMNAGLRGALLSRPDLAVDLFAESLDSDRLPADNAADALRESISRKYDQRPIDLVIAVSDAALEFVLNQRETLFPNVPVVFAALTAPDAAVRDAGAGMTGVLSTVALRETMQLALHLHPTTQRVFVLEAGATTASVRNQLAALGDRVDVSYVNDADLNQLLSMVSSIPPRSVVLLVLATMGAGNVAPSQVARRVAETARVPVYGMSDGFIGSGIVGTAGVSLPQLGGRLGLLALDVLSGRRPQELPIVEQPRRVVFDWRQVERWGIEASRLPAGSDIRFKQAGVWELYWPYIVLAISLFAVQGGLIAALISQRARRRASEEQHAAMLRAAPDLMFLLSRDGVYLGYNAADTGDLLVPPERFLGKQMRDVLPADVAGLFMDRFGQLVPGQPPEIIEYVLPMPGADRTYEARLVAVGANQVLAVVRDITERHRAEAALNEAQAELRRSSRLSALGQFAATIAHEIRQPLTAIVINARSCLRVIDQAPPDLEEIKAGLLDVVESSQRADEVIRRNRRLFRDQAVDVEPLDINGVITEAIALVTPRIEHHGVTIVTSLASHLPAIGGDRIELQQVLLNLLNNAVEAMEGSDGLPRRVRVSSALADREVTVSVSDNGVGLRGVNVSQMFALSYTTKATGTGVGLALSRSIIEAHGGKLWGQQNADRGATFSFTVPAVAAAVGDDTLVLGRKAI